MVLVPRQMCLPTGGELSSDAVVIAGLGGEPRDRQAGRTPAVQPKLGQRVAVLVAIRTDRDGHRVRARLELR